jgi:hypothetical protein
MLHEDILVFTQKVIRTRKVLIDNKVSKLNEKEALKTIEMLTKLIDYYGYPNDRAAAGFFVNHHKEIESLLPVPSSLAYAAFKDKYNELLERSFNYQNRHAVN